VTADRRPLVIRDPRFLEHRAPGHHPECPERLIAIERAIAPLAGRLCDRSPRPADDGEILRAHEAAHLAQLDALSGSSARLDPDTYSAPRSPEIARLAAGGAIDAARAVARGEAPCAFVLARPPGHHAERGRAMGFCLLNNAAIAVRALLDDPGLERVAVVDWDVHHGNGTQHAFEAERDVLFVSTHQFPLYPGTGAMREVGEGRGAGSTVNLPLPAGCGDGEYGAVFDALVVPVLLEFRPEMIVVSAGFDAHASDPLASMRVSTAGFAALAARIRAVADEHCGGRLLLLLEGGYDLDALGDSVRSTLEVLAAPEAPIPPHPTPAREFAPLVAKFREVQSHYWAALRSRTFA
jgi:acetoin utilization deacetylase AcuC-like enzyme